MKRRAKKMIKIKDIARATITYEQKMSIQEQEAIAFDIQTFLMVKKGVVCNFAVTND